MNAKLAKAQKIKVVYSGDIYPIMQQILMRENRIDRNKEHFWLVCLSTTNRILMIELISLGSVNATVVEPMDVFSFALQKRAVKLIMVHNHPSGELTPSHADLEITERMFSIGKFIKVPVIDHLIISETAYMSFADKGIIEKMEEENRFDLTFSEVDKLNEKVKNLEKSKTKEIKQQKIDLAKKMLKDKQSVKLIVEYTGLTAKEIEKLK